MACPPEGSWSSFRGTGFGVFKQDKSDLHLDEKGEIVFLVFLVIILAILIGDYLLNLIVDTKNVRHLRTDLPEEFWLRCLIPISESAI